MTPIDRLIALRREHLPPSDSEIRSMFQYDPQSGFLYWNVSRSRVRVGDRAGTPTSDGYRRVTINRRTFLEHRVIWLIVTGTWPMTFIDHRNGCADDNRWQNLRDVPQKLNLQNLRKAKSGNKSGFLGVSSNRSRWRAQIKVDGLAVSLGTYDTRELAYAAYLEGKRRLHPGGTI